MNDIKTLQVCSLNTMEVRCYLQIISLIVAIQIAICTTNTVLFGQQITVGYYNGDVNILTTFHDVKFKTCVRKCRFRQRCDFVNYFYRFKMCYLIEHFNKDFEASDLYSDKRGSVLGVKADWDVVSGNDLEENFEKDCGYPEIQHNIIAGNMFNPGAKAAYKCSDLEADFVSLKCKGGLWRTVQHGLIPEACYLDCVVWKYADSCYAFVWQEKANFLGADGNCGNLGGYLVHIGSQGEQKQLTQMLQHYNRTDWIFIGLTDEIKEGVFKWIGETTLPSFIHWNPGEPNGKTNENCAAMRQTDGYFWIDVSCMSHLSYICEFELQNLNQ